MRMIQNMKKYMSLEVLPSSDGDDDFDYYGRRCWKKRKLHYPSSLWVYPSRAAVFSAGRLLSPCVPKLLILRGDIETNPGPKTYICRICNNIINERQTSIQCNYKSKHWIHLKCSNIRLREYSPTFICSLHRNQDSDSNNDHSLTSNDSDIPN